MTNPIAQLELSDGRLDPQACQRAVRARDPRFDGVFFVGITTTRIYCRPVCPARVTYADRRRFFRSAAAAESAGYRPCLRCRPELAPGRALCDAVPRLADAAAQRIAAGALNGRSVADLASDLCVGERHLRRALAHELGVSPVELAQTHRLLLAKQLLADTDLPVTRIAYASGFQSLRRFNATFRERYRMSPSELRKSRRTQTSGREAGEGLVRVTLAYRPPFAWSALLEQLARGVAPGVEVVDASGYARTARIDQHTGVILIRDGTITGSARKRRAAAAHVDVDVSLSLVPALMPLLAKLRKQFDLDAHPDAVDAHLAQGGLAELVRARPGLRLPGSFDGFESALRVLLIGDEMPAPLTCAALGRLAGALGEPIMTGVPGLTRLTPTAARVAGAGAAQIVALGITPARAAAIVALARAVCDGGVRLEPDRDPAATELALRQVDGIDARSARAIVMQVLGWPDTLVEDDALLQRAARVADAHALLARAEAWRPWRAYAALHLRLAAEPAALAQPIRRAI